MNGSHTNALIALKELLDIWTFAVLPDPFLFCVKGSPGPQTPASITIPAWTKDQDMLGVRVWKELLQVA